MRRKFLLTEAEAAAPYVRAVLQDLSAATARWCHWERRVKQVSACRLADAPADFAAALRERGWAAEAIDAARGELARVGVRVVDPALGVAGYPFRWSKNRRSRRIRQALFLLMLDDDPARGIHAWRFCGDEEVRRIPPHWLGQMESPILAEVGA